jgi:hypothetical protein
MINKPPTMKLAMTFAEFQTFEEPQFNARRMRTPPAINNIPPNQSTRRSLSTPVSFNGSDSDSADTFRGALPPFALPLSKTKHITIARTQHGKLRSLHQEKVHNMSKHGLLDSKDPTKRDACQYTTYGRSYREGNAVKGKNNCGLPVIHVQRC